MTDQTWNLPLIGVRPDCQRHGRGTALLHYVEQLLTAQGGQMRLIETFGVAKFERPRMFYAQCGYEEARIRDFFAAGDDRVVLRRLLASG